MYGLSEGAAAKRVGLRSRPLLLKRQRCCGREVSRGVEKQLQANHPRFLPTGAIAAPPLTQWEELFHLAVAFLTTDHTRHSILVEHAESAEAVYEYSADRWFAESTHAQDIDEHLLRPRAMAHTPPGQFLATPLSRLHTRLVFVVQAVGAGAPLSI